LRKQLEAKNAQLQDYVYHLESIAALEKTITETGDIAQMMDSAMKITLSVFKCDRAWLLYPCDPNAPSFRVPIEVTTPKYPGANILNTNIPKDPAVSEVMKASLSATAPVALGPEYEHKVPSIAKQFSVQTMLCLAIHPKIGKPWLFGLHQCSYARVWTENEFKLFSEFGQQIGVSLGLSISFEELVKSEKRLSRERYHDFIGASMPMQTVYQMIDKVAASKAAILITGETGTGKELCAEAIHKESKRADKPFVVCNCAAIPENLQESHLFGHLKGAFTGANENRKGLVSQAAGGTLFLDEIGELPLLMQSTLLRFMQTKTFSKVGNHQLEKVNVRFICATNRNLLTEVKARRFREDLYHRLNVIEIELPALRKRGQDILLLAKFFLHQFAKEEQKDIQSFSAEAEKKLLSYEWFGNVRQLQNTIHKVVLLNGGKVITAEMLAAKIDKKVDNDVHPNQCNSMNCKDNLSLSHIARFSNNIIRPFEEIEKETILKTIEDCNGNVCKAARVLKISHGTIYNKLKGWKNKQK
jgi:two-component system repressor protein LuxO